MDCDCDDLGEPTDLKVVISEVTFDCEIVYEKIADELFMTWQAKADALGDRFCRELLDIQERWRK